MHNKAAVSLDLIRGRTFRICWRAWQSLSVQNVLPHFLNPFKRFWKSS